MFYFSVPLQPKSNSLCITSYKSVDPDGDDNKVTSIGLDADGSELTFGLYYNF